MKFRFLLFLAGLITGFTFLFFSQHAHAGVSVIHHELTLKLEPATRALEVRDLMRVEGSGEAVFDLASSLIITRLRVDGKAAVQNRQGNTLRLELGTKRRHDITLQYKGQLLPLPKSPGGFDAVPLMASEKGSYLASGSAWHPIVRGVAASYRLTVSLPDPQKAVVPGRLIEESSKAGQYRAVFESEIPTQGIVLIAGPFIVDEIRHDNILLRTYFSPGLEDLSQGYLESTADYIDLYKKRIGDYPFSSFSIISGPLPVGLGFAGLSYIGERVLRLPFIRFTSLGHEVLHNWWGNGVEIDYENGNWAEGLTTFMADYAFAERRGKGNNKRMRAEWLRDFAALPPRRDHPVRTFISRRHVAAQIIGYNKVAFIFHMLERKIGEKQFGEGIRKFWNRHKFATAGWADIQNAFEETSTQDLSVFFSQWLDRSGAPRLVMSDIYRTDGQISFTLSQPTLPYSLNVPIRLTTKDGEKMFLASIDGKASRIELPLSAPPLSIAIDPDFDIFRRLDATEAPPILRDTTLNPETLVVFAGSDAEMEKTARQLAVGLLDGRPRFADASRAPLHEGPLLIIGSTPAVRQFLHKTNLPTTPKVLLGRGTSRVWAARRNDNEGTLRSLLIIEADDTQALRSLLRPLPHYGRRGYLIFDGSKAVDDGVWPTESGPLFVTFE